MEQKILKVYDTLTKEYVDVEVSEEVYKAYKRSEWNIDKQDSSFEQHVIMFCDLNGEVENFDEMTSDEDTEKTADTKEQICKLRQVVGELSERDRKLLEMLFYENKTERECAAILNTTQQNIHKTKKRILCNLNKLLFFLKIYGCQNGCFFPYTSEGGKNSFQEFEN